MTMLLLLLLTAAVGVIILAIGMDSTRGNLIYLLTSALISIPYLHWRRRVSARAADASHPATL